MNFERRLSELRRYMAENHFRAAIVMKPVNQHYLSGFETVTYSRPILTVVEAERCSLILPGIEEAWSREISVADDFYPYFEHPLEAGRGISALGHLEPLIRKYPVGSRIGVEMDAMSCATGETISGWGYELGDISPKIVEMRAVKDADELDAIERAAKLVCTAVRQTALSALAGATELEIEALGTEAAKEQARRDYPGSVVTPGLSMCISGVERTVMPHTLTGPRKLQAGDVCLNTRQMALDGYYADCQRTFFVEGKRTAKQEEIYNMVLRAQRAAIAVVRPGAPVKDVEMAARNIIDEAGYGAYFTHRAGKSSGLEPLEEPYIRFDSDCEIKTGMVFNILPSVYVPGVGGLRVSDTVVVTADGCRVLTASCPKELDALVAK